ncbi:hypothetical protein BDR03DRAFT_974468 [Suillus americanus]|nr:hypothetical protein BDR03DRAFT_974468 [Suillus americanus]
MSCSAALLYQESGTRLQEQFYTRIFDCFMSSPFAYLFAPCATGSVGIVLLTPYNLCIVSRINVTKSDHMSIRHSLERLLRAARNSGTLQESGAPCASPATCLSPSTRI